MTIYRGSITPGQGSTVRGNADEIDIEDVGNILDATNVEDALQEIQTDLDTAESDIGILESGKQPLDDTLTSIAALGTTADKVAYTTGVDTWAEAAITAAGRALIDDADAATQRTTLGLGTAATQSIGTSGATVPLLSTTNTWSSQQDFSANGIVLSKGTFTPTVEGVTTAGVGTYSTQTGDYTEFDNCYVFSLDLAWSAHTGVGDTDIAGLPFVADGRPAVSVGRTAGLSTGTSGWQLLAVAQNGTTTIRLREVDPSTGTDTGFALDTSVTLLTLSGVIFK